MGVVYKATDTKLDRTVALKFLPPHLSADESAKQRFVQEAKAASALDHANICTIHDIDEDEQGRLFIVMTFYDGQTLKYRLDKGALPLSEAVDTGIQLSRGLARAHEAGIVHRDVKPANIMLTSRGEVKILDFGVAKLSESSDLTKAGSTVGTAAYMSPEQSKGESVDVRADVWSAGVLLYEMMTGQTPFEGGYEAALVYAIVNETPSSPTERDASIPQAVSDIVMKCLSKNPEERFSDAAHIAARLDEYKSPSGTKTVQVPVAAAIPEVDETGIPTAAKIATAYAPIAAATLAIVYGAMWFIGLPDWVFPLGVMLMLLGLPTLLMAANQDRRKAEGRDIGGPFSWLSYTLAVRGGFFAIGGLMILAISLSLMRDMGIGPTASLQASGALVDDAKIIVAEFDNRTDEAGLSDSVSELLRIALAQSNTVEVMDASDIVAVLSRMNRSTDDTIDLNTAMEIAAREGAEAVLHGEISPIGAGYFLSAKLLAAHDGSELVALSQTARSDNDVIDAVDELTKDLRERIGESIKSIRGNADLDRVTTSSLDALRLYTQGVAAEESGDIQRSIQLLNQSIERDPDFAMAYRKLAVVYGNANISFDLQVEASTNAYNLRERLPERERFMTVAYYHSVVTGDADKAVAAYESLLEIDPGNTAALNNVSIFYQRMGRYEDAIVVLERALEMGQRWVYYSNYFNTLAALKRYDEAEATLDKFEEVQPGHASTPSMRFQLAILRGDVRGADQLISISERSTQPIWLEYEAFLKQRFSELTGRMDQAQAYADQSTEYELLRGNKAGALNNFIGLAWNFILNESELDQAALALEKGLEEVPLDSISIYNRPYTQVASVKARLGEIDEAKSLMHRFSSELPEGIQRGDFSRHVARAEILRAEGNPMEAVETLRRGRLEDRCFNCFRNIEAMYLAEMDSVEQALKQYEIFQDWTTGQSVEFVGNARPAAWLDMGELYSRSGQTDQAIEAYSNFVDLWEEADADLQPKVRYARSRIERLLDQSVREPDN